MEGGYKRRGDGAVAAASVEYIAATDDQVRAALGLRDDVPCPVPPLPKGAETMPAAMDSNNSAKAVEEATDARRRGRILLIPWNKGQPMRFPWVRTRPHRPYI